jgi:hypothetical protein
MDLSVRPVRHRSVTFHVVRGGLHDYLRARDGCSRGNSDVQEKLSRVVGCIFWQEKKLSKVSSKAHHRGGTRR